MDRNLGAINAITGNIGSFGIYCQIGKKDIYPRVLNTSGVIAPIYNFSGQILVDDVDGIIKTQFAPASGNFPNTIKNPMTFYKSNYGTNTWYGQEVPFRNGTDSPWGTWRHKGDHDPCPEGWRVMLAPTLILLGFAPSPSNYVYDYGSTIGVYPGAGHIAAANGYFSSIGSGYYGIRQDSGQTGGYYFSLGRPPSSAVVSGSTAAFSIRCVKY